MFLKFWFLWFSPGILLFLAFPVFSCTLYGWHLSLFGLVFSLFPILLCLLVSLVSCVCLYHLCGVHLDFVQRCLDRFLFPLPQLALEYIESCLSLVHCQIFVVYSLFIPLFSFFVSQLALWNFVCRTSALALKKVIFFFTVFAVESCVWIHSLLKT